MKYPVKSMIRHNEYGNIYVFEKYYEDLDYYICTGYHGSDKSQTNAYGYVIDELLASGEWTWYPAIVVIDPIKLDEELFTI